MAAEPRGPTIMGPASDGITSAGWLPAAPNHYEGIPPPTLNSAQQGAFERIAFQDDGAWARAFFDGTAEACSAYRGGLRRVVLDREGREVAVEEIPPGPRVVRGNRLALTLVALGLAGGAFVALRVHAGARVGLSWTWPAICLVALLITAAYCFGVYSRLPAPQFDAGAWIGLPGAGGDVSGHTMPGFVRAHPFFAFFYLAFFNVFCVAVVSSEPTLGAGELPLGLVAGTSAWWFLMLCFSRGWVKEGD